MYWVVRHLEQKPSLHLRSPVIEHLYFLSPVSFSWAIISERRLKSVVCVLFFQTLFEPDYSLGMHRMFLTDQRVTCNDGSPAGWVIAPSSQGGKKNKQKSVALSLSHARRARTLLLNYIIYVFFPRLKCAVGRARNFHWEKPTRVSSLFRGWSAAAAAGAARLPACIMPCHAMPLLDFIFSVRILSHSPECCCWPATSSI